MKRAVEEAKIQLNILNKQSTLVRQHLQSLKSRRKRLEAHWQENNTLYRDNRKAAHQKTKESLDKLLLLSKKELEFESPHVYVEKCLQIVNDSVENGTGDGCPTNGTKGIADDILDELCLIPGSIEHIQNAYLELVIDRQKAIKDKLVRLYTCLEKINSFYDIKVTSNINQRERTLELIKEYQVNEFTSKDSTQKVSGTCTTSRNSSPEENLQINKDNLITRFMAAMQSAKMPTNAEDELDSLRKLLKFKMELATKNIPPIN